MRPVRLNEAREAKVGHALPPVSQFLTMSQLDLKTGLKTGLKIDLKVLPWYLPPWVPLSRR